MNSAVRLWQAMWTLCNLWGHPTGQVRCSRCDTSFWKRGVEGRKGVIVHQFAGLRLTQADFVAMLCLVFPREA